MNLKRIFTLFLSVVMIYLVVPETELRVSASVAAGQTVICVSPTGSADGRGTEKSPLDIYTAVEQALPGQTIFLMGSTYSLNKPLVIARGIDGTAGQRITLMGDPENRPVLNAGVVLAADYWYLQGFDVTNTADGVTGVLVSGNNNTLDQINTYGNGGTGIEICTYLPTDTKAEWPSGNLILNCSSYGNAGSGNLADGFAASLTVGDNNVFDGCIAHHNADDGFDISAAVETGPIGQVVIQNSVAYKNGYLLNNTPAGSGRGFKLGSGRISGYHILINSIAFDNKWAGISSGDVAEELYKASDFPPEERIAAREARGMKMGAHDAIILNSTAFNNERYNVQLDPYGDDSNSVVNTDYSVTGFLSFRTEYTDVRDRTSPRGRQDITKFYNTTNYYWNESKSISVNSVLNEVAAEWFESLTFSTITRNTDGTINMNDFLELTATAPSDTGARMSGTPSPVFQVEMPVDEEPKEPDIIFPSYTPTFDPSYTSYPPAPTYTTADTENYTSKTGITSTVTITDGGVEVNAGINKSGSVNSEATAAAVKKAAQIARENGETSITIKLPETATGLSASTIQKLVKAASGTEIVLALTSINDGEKVGNISLPINSKTGQILTGIYFETQRIHTVQNYIKRTWNTEILGAFETAQKGGWGATATLSISLEKLGFTADDGDKLYALIYDTKAKKWYQSNAEIIDGNVNIKTKRTGIITIVTDSVK